MKYIQPILVWFLYFWFVGETWKVVWVTNSWPIQNELVRKMGLSASCDLFSVLWITFAICIHLPYLSHEDHEALAHTFPKKGALCLLGGLLCLADVHAPHWRGEGPWHRWRGAKSAGCFWLTRSISACPLHVRKDVRQMVIMRVICYLKGRSWREVVSVCLLCYC